MTPDPNQLARLARQHAETARLLGVDFVPAYRSSARSGDTAGNVPFALVPGDDPAPEPAAPPRTPRPRPAASIAEAKPAAPGPAARADSLDAITSLDELRARYEADAPHAAFDTSFTNIVFGDGDPNARLMFVGEAPGEEEDNTGVPFVGRAGQLLNKMIEAMGLSRETVYIANVLKTRPPQNRTPTPDEVAACAPYLFHQIRLVAPEAIVTLGRPASQLLLQTSDAMGRLRGSWRAFPPAETLLQMPGIDPIPVMPTYHPAYLLRSYTAENRAKVWSDLQQVMVRLKLK